ncbi:serine protease 29-like [Leguminivora glycinivorella]|uniref:serine protease 29-like n=1 Tax=Leguminivora glycinivorella TaxID=1035111 RepID=UPI00200BF222|nr:serine protease 29-like [Leguminivora glycinivorella]
MGAGQIGGIATMLEFDFENAAGFVGRPATNLDGQYVVYYFSQAMLFCAGALIEPHMVLTPAVCVFGEEFMFNVFAGSHRFKEGLGTKRQVENICMHRAYNHTGRWDYCPTDNIALLVLNSQFAMRHYEPKTEYIINRVRYGVSLYDLIEKNVELQCRYYGWGSRRNGFLLPLLIHMHRVDVKVLSESICEEVFNTDGKYLCLSQPNCINDKFGALCPDDLGSVLVCGGYIQGMMTSELIDRPCGVGFLDVSKYFKFLVCAVDDSRDAIKELPPVSAVAVSLQEQVPEEPEETTTAEDVVPEHVETRRRGNDYLDY